MTFLKVCYLLPRLLPGKSGIIVGGCASNCISLALELRRQGIQIELLAPVPEKRLEFLSRHPVGEIVRPLPSLGGSFAAKGIGAIYVLRRALKKLGRETRYDIVHSHSGTYSYAMVPLAADRKTSVRLHSLYCPFATKGGVYSSWWEKPTAARLIFNRLDRIIAVTDNVRQSIEKSGVPPEKIESISMCVDRQRFYPRNRKEPSKYFPNKSKGTRILFIGNSSKEKGLIDLLEALQILTEKGIPFFLVAAVENQSEIKEYSHNYDVAKRLVNKLRLEKHVRLVGLVDPIQDLYVETDLLVIPWNTSRGPSDYPMVALEGMAMGKCIISTPVGGCPELLRDGKLGILTQGYSPTGIAAAIEYAIKHPEICLQLGQASIEAAKSFSAEGIGRQMMNLYESLLRSK